MLWRAPTQDRGPPAPGLHGRRAVLTAQGLGFWAFPVSHQAARVARRLARARFLRSEPGPGAGSLLASAGALAAAPAGRAGRVPGGRPTPALLSPGRA